MVGLSSYCAETDQRDVFFLHDTLDVKKCAHRVALNVRKIGGCSTLFYGGGEKGTCAPILW